MWRDEGSPLEHDERWTDSDFVRRSHLEPAPARRPLLHSLPEEFAAELDLRADLHDPHETDAPTSSATSSWSVGGALVCLRSSRPW